MDITQLLLTIGAVVGIVIVGLLAIVPTLIEMPEREAATRARTYPEPTPLRPRPVVDRAYDIAA